MFSFICFILHFLAFLLTFQKRWYEFKKKKKRRKKPLQYIYHIFYFILFDFIFHLFDEKKERSTWRHLRMMKKRISTNWLLFSLDFYFIFNFYFILHIFGRWKFNAHTHTISPCTIHEFMWARTHTFKKNEHTKWRVSGRGEERERKGGGVRVLIIK